MSHGSAIERIKGEEYRIHWDLSIRERMAFRKDPEGFMRNFLVENDYPHEINGIAFLGSIESCYEAADVEGQHINEGILKSIIVVV